MKHSAPSLPARVLALVALAALSLQAAAPAAARADGDGPADGRWDAVKARVAEIADEFAAYQLGKNPSANSQAVQSCPMLLRSLVSDLPVATGEKRPAPRGEPMFRWIKPRVADLLSTVGWNAIWVGLMGPFVVDLVTPDQWHAVIDGAGSFLLNHSWNAILAGMLWDSFLPNPKVPIPVGLNPRRGQLTVADVTDPDIEAIQKLFLARLAQHGLKPPAYIEPQVWVEALANGLPRDVMTDPAAIVREVAVLKRRIDMNIAPLAHGVSTLGDEADRLSIELQTSRALKPSALTPVRRKQWLARAVPALTNLVIRANALQEGLRIRSLQSQYEGLIRFGNENGRRFYFTAGNLLFGMTPLEDFLRRVSGGAAGSVEFSADKFEVITQPDRVAGQPGVVSFEVTVTLREGSKTGTRSFELQARTYENTMAGLMERDPTWAFEATGPVTDILRDFQLGLLPTYGTESSGQQEPEQLRQRLGGDASGG